MVQQSGDEYEPGDRWRELLVRLRDGFLELIAEIPAYLYFGIYWIFRDQGRQFIQLSALGFITLSVALLFIEILFHVMFEADLLKYLLEYIPGISAIALYGAFACAVLIILLYHVRERRYEQLEYTLSEKIWAFLRAREVFDCEQQLIEAMLKSAVETLSRFGSVRAWLWLYENGKLRILDNCAFPPTDDHDYIRELDRGTGIAGLVFADSKPRYVPRLFFPFNGSKLRRLSKRFDYVISFQIDRKGPAELNVAPARIAKGQIVGQFPRGLTSFVCVPLDPAGEESCIGVLSVDFGKTNPLARSDIKIPAILATILADELVRIRSRRGQLVQSAGDAP